MIHIDSFDIETQGVQRVKEAFLILFLLSAGPGVPQDDGFKRVLPVPFRQNGFNPFLEDGQIAFGEPEQLLKGVGWTVVLPHGNVGFSPLQM